MNSVADDLRYRTAVTRRVAREIHTHAHLICKETLHSALEFVATDSINNIQVSNNAMFASPFSLDITYICTYLNVFANKMDVHKKYKLDGAIILLAIAQINNLLQTSTKVILVDGLNKLGNMDIQTIHIVHNRRFINHVVT